MLVTSYLMTDPGRGWPLLFPLQSLKYPFSQLSWINVPLSLSADPAYWPGGDSIRTLCSTPHIGDSRPRGRCHPICWGRPGSCRDPCLMRMILIEWRGDSLVIINRRINLAKEDLFQILILWKEIKLLPAPSNPHWATEISPKQTAASN